MSDYNTEYTNFLPLFTDLNLDPDTDMLWLMNHGQPTSLKKLEAKPIWKNRKNIFLVDSETHLIKNQQYQKDSRIHVWTPTATNMPRSYPWLFWFNWMQEIETSLECTKKLQTDNTKPFLFDALLGTKRHHKDILANHVNTSAFANKIFYRYVGNCNNSNGLYTIGADEELPNSDVIYNKTQRANGSLIVPYKIYNQCWYSLVTETEGDFPNFYSEKTGRPLLAKRLFIVFAAQYHLKRLKEFGFKTFDGIINEGYDNISNIQERYAQAWKQVEFLVKQDPVEIYKLAQPILEHNHNHFMQTNWKKEMHEKIQNISHLSK